MDRRLLLADIADHKKLGGPDIVTLYIPPHTQSVSFREIQRPVRELVPVRGWKRFLRTR